MLIVGAGGVALAIAAALIEAGVRRIDVLNRTPARAEAMIDRLRRLAGGLGRQVALGIAEGPDASRNDLVINATSLGMHDGDALPFDVDTIGPNSVVAEVVMNPELTPVLDAARKRGARIIPGREMILGQIDPFIDFVLSGAK